MADTGATFGYDPFSPEAMRDPHSLYPVLREKHPAYFIPDYDTWVFSRYQDVWDGFLNSEHFSEAEGQVFARETLLDQHRGNPPEHRLNPEKAMFLWLDPPVHTQFRQALAAPFLKGNVNRLEPHIAETVRRRLEVLIPLGRFDLNKDFASYISVRVTGQLMGLPHIDTEHMVRLFSRLVARAPGQSGRTEDGTAARREIIALLAGEVRRRRQGRGPESPVIDPLIAKDIIGRRLSDEEVAVDAMSILVGGTETVPKVFSGGLLELARRPEQLAAVAADPEANSGPAFEEMLRYNAPAQWFGRTVKHATSLGGARLDPGQRVILLIASANRDPREFDRPDEFIWNRKVRRMLSFGVGPHFCIGIHLARLEGKVMLREFLKAVPAFTIEPDAGHFAESEFQIGWTNLPVRVTI
jgi:cytochrome P450